MTVRFKIINLRATCFIIAYMNLLAVIVDIICHVMAVAIVTRGFQCDVDEYSIAQVDWPWVEHILVIINIGTHGFYPFPLAPRSQKMNYLEYLMSQTTVTPAQCYPGMIHVYLIDVLNLMINIMWLNFVKSYLVAVHKKDHNKMSAFFVVSIIKVVLQIIYFEYYPGINFFGTSQAFWSVKLIDICLAVCTLFVILEYKRELRQEEIRAAARRLEPPPYIECLISGPVKSVAGASQDEKVPVILDGVDKIEVITLSQPLPQDNASRT